MDTQRLILFVIFSMSGFFLWQAWESERNPRSAPATVAISQGKEGEPAASGHVPDAPSPGKTMKAPAEEVPAPTGVMPVSKGERIRLSTDALEVTINTEGGVIERVALLKHKDTLDKSRPYTLLQNGDGHTHLAQSGLLGENLPNHRTMFTAQPGARSLGMGADRLELRLEAPTVDGIRASKVFTVRPDSYLIEVGFEVVNGSSKAIDTHAYFQLLRDGNPPAGQHSMVPSYTGAVVYSEQDKFTKLEFADIDKGKTRFTKTTDNGWVGMLEHYFVAAWLPRDGEPKLMREFYAKKSSGDGAHYIAGVLVPLASVAPGGTARVAVPLYAGPQEQEKLAALAKGLDLTTDYGIFTVIAAPLFLALQWLYKLVGNWGWAIVLLTVLLKLVFYPLNTAAARSMGKMKLVGPKLKALQEQYANDKQQLQIRMMELYKTEKINPLGGCLPILVQMPVFLALYWVLLAAVELRHAPWLGWITDLSGPDPFYVLPVVYAITAYAQVKLSPTPVTDPMQARMMQIMPIAFSVMFIFFPSGLVLYWLVNNVLSIGQQWHVNRLLTREQASASAKR
ncbi:MAG: membrane protein insertase YidC [Betaproteobacteria bacterium]|nr:membrane protein insertase YidC [Betaproteobacteria bacterium]